MKKLILAFAFLLAFVAAPSSQTPTVLTQADITFLGYYDVQTNGQDTSYSRGLYLREEGTAVRFGYLQLGGDLHEFSTNGLAFGSRITTATTRYPLGGTGVWDFIAFQYEAATNRLWSTTAIDYTNTAYPVQMFTRTLNTNGTVSNVRGPVGLQGLNAKRIYSGMSPLPSWFQQQYKVGPYAVGACGYTSLVAQGGGAVIGPCLYAIPDPAGFAPNTEIPTSQYRTLLNYEGTRGYRITCPVNYYDGGDSRQNPPTRPTDPPLSTAQWLSPDANGDCRWVWGDHTEGFAFVDGTAKRGVIMLTQVATGSAWYANSTLNSDGRACELHIYDPAHLGEVATGLRTPSSVRPVSMRVLPECKQAWTAFTGNGTMFSSAYDPRTQRLHVLVFAGGADVYTARHLVYQINAGGSTTTPPPPPPTDPVPPSSGLPAGAVRIAVQQAMFTLPAAQTVYYHNDAGTQLISKAFTAGTYQCSHGWDGSATTFPSDPASGQDKWCSAVPVVAPPPPPPPHPPPPPPPADPCIANPGVLVVSAWPTNAEGSRQLRYDYSVSGVTTTARSVVLTFAPGAPSALTVTDARGCVVTKGK